MREFYLNNKNFIDKLMLLVSIAAFLALAVFVAGYVAPFVAGYVISLILSPLVTLIHNKWRIHRGLLAAVLILGLLSALFFLGSFVFDRIANEIIGLEADIQMYFANAIILIENMMARIESMLGAEWEIDFDALLNQLLTLAVGMLQGAIQGGTFAAIPVFILRVIIAIVSAFFFIKDKERIAQSIAALFPKHLVERYRIVRQGLLKALVGYAKGQLMVMALVTSVCFIGLIIIGSPYALFISIGIGIFDLIPVFGAGGILIPWAVYHFIAGNFSFGIGLLIIYGVVFLTRQMLEARIVGYQIGIHPILLLMSVYVGIVTMGPVGILAGPLIALTIKTTMEADFSASTEAVKKRPIIYRRRKKV
ncbi:MAG: sporulation integral membrane protein YtvI [Clostridiales bacterium]|nr:sporulation integral membrane protein YtvI [Clostridiales bacterium]